MKLSDRVGENSKKKKLKRTKFLRNSTNSFENHSIFIFFSRNSELFQKKIGLGVDIVQQILTGGIAPNADLKKMIDDYLETCAALKESAEDEEIVDCE